MAALIGTPVPLQQSNHLSSGTWFCAVEFPDVMCRIISDGAASTENLLTNQIPEFLVPDWFIYLFIY